MDPDAGKVVGTISGLHGVHGIAIANDLGKGFITNGQSGSVTIFDLKTLAKSAEPAAGKNPDAVCYEPKTKHVFAINHTGGDATAIDAKTGEVLKTFPIGASAEFCQADGAGKLYVNIESSNEVVEIDAAKKEVTRRTSILPCEGPSGLAIDVKGKKLFSVCDGVMAVTDIPTFKVIATPKIGQGPDAAAFDPALGPGVQLQRLLDGTLSIVKPVNGKYQTVDTRHHRARRAHHGAGPEDAQDLPAGRGIRPGAAAQGRPEERPRTRNSGQLPRAGGRQVAFRRTALMGCHAGLPPGMRRAKASRLSPRFETPLSQPKL